MNEFGSKTASPDRYGILKTFAKENRRNMTLCERLLWEALREELREVRFRRQHPIGDYIVDFACLPKRLVIEVDGGYHSEPRQEHDDAVRTIDLKRMGYHVIRFSNEEIINDTNQVIQTIKQQMASPTPPLL